MQKIFFILSLIAVFLISVSLFAQSSLDIFGESIPVYSQSRKANVSYPELDANVAAFDSSSSVSAIVDYYSNFFENSGYVTIGGMQEGGFNIMAQKNKAKFSLRIFKTSKGSRIEFIW